MNKKKLKAALFDIGRDIVIAFVIVCVVMLALFAYCGIWPPMVVVESGSMQRYDDRSVVGVIDTGDMVFVKKIKTADDIITYVDGQATEYSKYGNFGDVIIYRPNGLTEYPGGIPVVPIIHRPVLWIEVNTSKVSSSAGGIDFTNYTFDIPSLGYYGTLDDIVLERYGHWNQTVTISLGLDNGLLRYFQHINKEPHGGFITMGDHNVPAYDQPMSGSYEPVLPEWIVGKAWGEIPWFGLVKLRVTGSGTSEVPRNSWTNLLITLAIILIIPFVLDFVLPRVRKKKKEEKENPESNPIESDDSERDEPAPQDGQDDLNIKHEPVMVDSKDSKEKIIILKEIVKVPCPYCDVLVENTCSKCPSCGGKIR